MRFSDFLKEKKTYIIAILVVTLLSGAMIWATHPSGKYALTVFVCILFLLGASIPLGIEYFKKRNFYHHLQRTFVALDRKNLIGELISRPSFKEGTILYDLLKASNKAMLEEINKYKYIQEEYQEYIELWVHEVKTPIASSRLIALNNKSKVMDNISEELEKIEAFVEQALFYSRSNAVENDYIIKQINLKKLTYDLLKKNSKLFIYNKVSVITENLDVDVFSDVKWLTFIFNQLFANAIKYLDKNESIIKISAEEKKNSIIFSIKDNGIGIQESELPRIFNKGFTGTNGRKNQRSTGMGLYICKKLCNKLGLVITVASKYGQGTTISIIFPKDSMMNIS